MKTELEIREEIQRLEEELKDYADCKMYQFVHKYELAIKILKWVLGDDKNE